MENPVASQKELENWLHEVLAVEKPAQKISAFRFGLGEVEEGYVLYLAGSEYYDEADDEWAADTPEFIAGQEMILSTEDEWYWVLLKVIYSLGRILRTDVVDKSFLGDGKPVYLGFESGDLYRLK